MADVFYNVSKTALAQNTFDLETSSVKALLLSVCPAGCLDPDLATVDAVLGVATAAEPAAGERVTVGGRTATTDDANNRSNVSAGTATFAVDAGQSAVAILYYNADTDTNDTTRVPLSIHEFTSKSLDGGLDVDPATNWLQIS